MKTANGRYLLAIGVALASVLFLVLAIGALGMIADGGREDRGYAAILVVGAIGAVASRLRASGMALTLAAMAITVVVVTAVALISGVPDGASIVDLLGLTAMYAALFSLSAWLFRRAAEQSSATAVEG
jgi:hypothetical protein